MFENQQLSNADAVPSFLAHRRLALHAARAGTLHQALDLGDGDAVVVAQNRVLQEDAATANSSAVFSSA